MKRRLALSAAVIAIAVAHVGAQVMLYRARARGSQAGDLVVLFLPFVLAFALYARCIRWFVRRSDRILQLGVIRFVLSLVLALVSWWLGTVVALNRYGS